MLDHQGRKDYMFDETAQVYAELSRLAPVIDATQFVASAAILFSDEIGWAWNHIVSTRLQGMLETCDISTQGRLLRWYEPLYAKKISVDILDPLRDLSSYEVVFAPMLYLIHPEIVENLKRYVREGGLLIAGPKMGLKKWSNVFYSEVPPCGGLADLFGTAVKTAPFRLGRTEMHDLSVAFEPGAPFAASERFANEGLFDNLEPAQAVPIARHKDGNVAVTLNTYGEGQAIYVGCQPERAFYARLIEWLVDAGRLEPALNTDADVEVTKRVGGGHTLIFVLNHNSDPVEVPLEREYRELISEQTVSGTLVIGPQDVRILSL